MMTSSKTDSPKARLLVGASVLACAVMSDVAEAREISPSAAAEAEAGQAVDQITITARRREEKLQDVPITVSAVSGQVLKAERLDRVADYAAKIANFAAL